MDISAVDMFCGAGGLTYGLEQVGISVNRGLDIDRHSSYPYETNTNSSFRRVDIKPLARDPEPIKQMFPWKADVKVLAACAPCQPYSTLSHAKKGDTTDHEKWGLLDDFRKIVEYVEPDVIVTENVLQVRHDDTYRQFEETLKEMGYTLNDPENRKVYGPEYGIPQKRKRWVLLASQEGPIQLPDPLHTDETEYPTVRETIGHLPPLEAGEIHPDLGLHRARTLSDTNLERIRHMEPGADWRLWEERGLDHLLADCHKKDSGRSYKAPYSRMRPDEPSPTITTQFYNYGSGRFGHYDTAQDRALSLLEGALLQTFPEEYEFYDNFDDVGVKNVGRLIGNAVPPLLGQHIGEAIVQHVSGTVSTASAKADD
ncbi:DNA cytosine methyltransferase [Haloarcula pellucida]|uniref:DNA (cytosine-5-)-methyltransferase n=1 Tax=Haloarcula pellucida TaxID=1427151 RepID=A0A830GRU7_9EURY|nr:DNA cytosine methyltransferase [Halomicroarcula pellucida]MBX0349013.1 DNA cytosine methyltransferase [Halomicroarcula pellucida]GGN98612.1 cytosine-specific methyltransferase [Halomicroarcula pellucida]